MEPKELIKQIDSIRADIAALPKGNASFKTIKGTKRLYLQWTEDGKRHSKYVKAADQDAVIADIERRKQLEAELRELESKLPSNTSVSTGAINKAESDPLQFKTRVAIGTELSRLCNLVAEFQCRDCMRTLNLYLERKTVGRVCLLYGLRRTGKTTLLFQAMAKLPTDKTAYIKIMNSDDFSALEHDMRVLSQHGYQYVFIDEVTLLKDFIDSASLFSDIYAMMGMKIVMSGTDSLGFLLSTSDELYDRAYTIHTTFISFREYSRLLGIHDIDEYIRYGGTFRVGETNFDDPELNDEAVSFRDDESTRRYIDTAIAHNIQHSLAHYRNGTHFRHLLDLYDAGELTSAVNRIVEDMNHSFLLSVLTREFLSNDLHITRKNLRKNPDPEKRSDALSIIDEDAVVDRLRHILDIRNKAEMKVELTSDHVREIKEYLYLLDLIVDCPIETIGGERPIEHIIFSQPGMRYSQAQALVFSLMKDPAFAALSAAESKMVTERILQEVRGRMLEEIVLLETAKATRKGTRVFKLQFPVGEFDMAKYDSSAVKCQIYEIKHSAEVVPAQYRFLQDENMCAATEHRYGPIEKKVVLYRGANQEVDGILYQNVEEYLESL